MVLRLAVLLLLSGTGTAVASAQAWPLARGGPLRSGFQQEPSRISEPAERASFVMGGGLAGDGWRFGDVDLDGEPEVVLVRGGRAVVRKMNGTVLWVSEPLRIDRILAIDDLDGDGRVEIYCGGLESGPISLEGATGRVLWRPAWNAAERLGQVLPIDNGTGPRSLYVADLGCATRGMGSARIYRFDTLASPAVVELDTSGHGYWCGIAQTTSDVDGDGVLEVVSLSDDHVYVYDTRDGRPLYASGDIGGGAFGNARTAAVDLDGDGGDELIVMSDRPGTTADAPTRRIVVLDFSSGALSVVFERRFDAIAGVHRFLAQPTVRLADRSRALLTSFLDPSTATWHLVGYRWADLLASEPWFDIPRASLDAIVDADGDGIDEVLVAEAVGESLPSLSTLSLRGTSSGTLETLAMVSGSRFVPDVEPWTGRGRPPVFGGGVVVFTDRDGDGREDGPSVLTPFGSRSAMTLPGAARSLHVEPPFIVISSADGYVSVWDSTFSLANDTSPPDGVADLFELGFSTPAFVVGGSPPTLIAVNSSSRVVAHQLGADAPTWESRLSAATPAAVGIVGRGATVVWWTRMADGGLDLVGARIDTGAELFSHRASSSDRVRPLNDILPLELGAAQYLLHGVLDQRSNLSSYALLAAAGGSARTLDFGRRTTCTVDRMPSARDVDADGYDEILLSQGNQIRVISALRNEVVSSAVNTPCGGVLALGDVDGDGETDAIQAEPFGPRRRRLDGTLTPIWSFDLENTYEAPTIISTPTVPHTIAVTERDAPTLVFLDGATGAPSHTLLLVGGHSVDPSTDLSSIVPPKLTAPASTGDLTGDGTAHVLVGSSDGYLYAVSVDGSLTWTMHFPAAVSGVEIADADADGLAEIVVSVGDGLLRVIGQAELSGPLAVFDTDGSFVASSSDEDVDVIRDGTTVGASWPDDTMGTTYEYQLRTVDGVVIVPWTETGAVTSYTRSDLRLQHGMRYEHAVRAHASDDETRVSVEVVSDGFVVIDDAAPEVLLTADPALVFPEDDVVVLTLAMRDRFALASYELGIAVEGGAPVFTLAAEPVGGLEAERVRPWGVSLADGVRAAPGIYEGVATVLDAVGNRAEARARIVVCGRNEDDPPECGVVERRWLPTGGGCSCHDGSQMYGFAPLLVWFGLRRRRGRNSSDQA